MATDQQKNTETDTDGQDREPVWPPVIKPNMRDALNRLDYTTKEAKNATKEFEEGIKGKFPLADVLNFLKNSDLLIISQFTDLIDNRLILEVQKYFDALGLQVNCSLDLDIPSIVYVKVRPDAGSKKVDDCLLFLRLSNWKKSTNRFWNTYALAYSDICKLLQPIPAVAQETRSATQDVVANTEQPVK